MSDQIFVQSPKDLPKMPTGAPLFFILKVGRYVSSAYRNSKEDYDQNAWEVQAFTNEAAFLEEAMRLCEKGVPTDVLFLKGDRILPRTQVLF